MEPRSAVIMITLFSAPRFSFVVDCFCLFADHAGNNLHIVVSSSPDDAAGSYFLLNSVLCNRLFLKVDSS